MKTYQDFLKVKETGLQAFLIDAINDFKCSMEYENAVDAQAYYNGDNTTILSRKPYFFTEHGKCEDITKANNQVATNFLEYIVTQEVSTLLSNGLTTNDDIKEGLGKDKFDVLLNYLGLYALIDGRAWAYNYIDSKGNFKTDTWRGTEFVPLFDEENGILRAGIRFYQIAPNRPIFVEFYEEDGVSKYKIGKDTKTDSYKFTTVKEKRAYNITVRKDILKEEVINEFNWSVLPIFPLYANEKKRSVFTRSLKSKIDLYDIVLSDFGNNLEDSQDVYWVLKNYDGQNLGEFLEQYKKYKAIKVGMDGEATANTIDVPFEARQIALDMLEKMIFKEAMALDTTTLTGSSLNTTAIKAASYALDRKVDKFEWQVIDLVENIINLYLEWKNTPNEEYEIKFVRSGLTNDTELIDNLMNVREEISDETFYSNLPFVENAQQEIERMQQQSIDKFKVE